MASSRPKEKEKQVPPDFELTSLPSASRGHETLQGAHSGEASKLHRRLHRPSQSKETRPKHIRLAAPPHVPRSSVSSIYMGSYGHNRSRTSISSVKSPRSGSISGTPRTSLNHSHLADLLQDLNLDLETYGVEELRDGFFDASFFKPPRTDHDDLMRHAEETLPAALREKHPLSPMFFLPKQWHGIQTVCKSIVTSRAGIKLIKSFLAFFVTYILCLIPIVRTWLGRYCYIMVLASILNHPGRTIGAQIDGAFLTILGTATGLGWGSFGLWISDSTAAARSGYGGVLAAFLVLFMGIIAILRSYYIRVYQFVLCAGIAITYTCLAETSEVVNWRKLFDFGIPWLCGEAINLFICFTVFPDAGSRLLAVSHHEAFKVMVEGLTLPQVDAVSLHQKLSWTFVQASQAHRDLVLDISLTRFKPKDVEIIRNLMQAVIRSLLSLKMDIDLFDELNIVRDEEIAESQTAGFSTATLKSPRTQIGAPSTHMLRNSVGSGQHAPIDNNNNELPRLQRTDSEDRAVRMVADKLAQPTSELLSCMKTCLLRGDAVLMDMSGYRKYLGPPKTVSSDILGALTKIRKTMIKYDEEEDALMANPDLPPTYSNHPQVVELFLFVHPIRQAATNVENLLVKVMEMQQQSPGWRVYLPSYPLAKALQRTNAQVRHDRGGVTAGFFFTSQSQLARTMRGMANVYKPLPRQAENPRESGEPAAGIRRAETLGKYEEEEELALNRNLQTSREKRLRYRLWMVLKRLQGFETRFGLKVALVTSLLSIPAWLPQSRGWWNENESWWVVVSVWIMMHPRIGGNIQDLATRAFCCVLGAVWGGLAYGAGNGNPYVMAVFAAIYMLPMIYRYTQSRHPRSGLIGCIPFIVVSLSARTTNGLPSVVTIAWTRGAAFVVGVLAAIMVNWILWPFVARHELRKALAGMMIYSSIIYRGVVAQYVYYEEGEEPGEDRIQRSEMLEGRLREGFVRIRQLMALTRHEIRLRSPFNPLPYSALIDACERFFEYLVAVRQSSLFFHPHFMNDNKQAAESLLAYRRDAVAAILMNLYVLAGALRGGRKLPRYLPSAAAARRRLLDHMEKLEAEEAENPGPETVEHGRRWGQIYSYSYNQSLTGCVKQLEQLQRYTKEIVGEQGFDPTDTDESEQPEDLDLNAS